MYYKLTDENMCTYRGFKWEIGKKVVTSGEGPLCSKGWIHCYHDPRLAVIFNPIHANFSNPRLFEIEVGGKSLDDYGVKIGWSEVILEEEIPVPTISLIQRVAFGILCAKKVCRDEFWNKWADKWLSGEDRTLGAARAIRAAGDASWVDEAARAATWAARAAEAARAAWAVARAARAAWAAGDARDAVARAAEAAWAAGDAVAGAARDAWHAGEPFDLIFIVSEAMKY